MTGTRKVNSRQRLKRLVVAGAGNIGSSLIPHLGRLPGVGHVTIIDRDVYEAKNLLGQDILPRDVGLAKAAVQARRLRRVNPSLLVLAVEADLHDVPLGMLRADAILACLDSLEARRVAGQAAWRLGVPMVDAGINAEGGLYARVTVYAPGPQGPCLQCGWDDSTYARLEHSQPCMPGPAQAASTNAPASLGALAAAVQAIECRKLLEGDLEHALIGRQVLLDLRHHTHRVTSFRRNPQCRFDHDGIWRVRHIGRGPDAITFGQVLDSAALTGKAGVLARSEGRPFVRNLRCPRCERCRKTLGLLGRLSARQAVCGSCGKPMEPIGFDMVDRLDLSSADREVLSRPLARLGFRRGDIFSVGTADGEELHYEIGKDGM